MREAELRSVFGSSPRMSAFSLILCCIGFCLFIAGFCFAQTDVIQAFGPGAARRFFSVAGWVFTAGWLLWQWETGRFPFNSSLNRRALKKRVLNIVLFAGMLCMFLLILLAVTLLVLLIYVSVDSAFTSITGR